MSQALEIAQRYFELSNQSKLDEIEKLLDKSSTYSSQNSGVFLGVLDIVAMQRRFHSSFKALNWQILSVDEVSPGIVLFEFVFKGDKHSGETVNIEGLEYVIVFEEKIQHIEVRNK